MFDGDFISKPMAVVVYQPYEQPCYIPNCPNTLWSYDTGCLCESCNQIVSQAEGDSFFGYIGGADRWAEIDQATEERAIEFSHRHRNWVMFHLNLMFAGVGL